MPTYIGENKIVDRYLGDKFLEAAYIGDKKVYDPYTEIAGYLPAIFKSRATVSLKNYRIYGTSEGAGVETSGTEPAGYKLPLTITSGAQSQDIPIYIGDSKLGEEEYVDYGEQKVYKRTENLFDKSTAILGKEIRGDGIFDNADWAITPLIPVEPQSYYSTFSFGVARLEYISENDNNPIRATASSQNPTLSTTHFIRLNLAINNLTTATLVNGSTPPDHYIPYLQSTDPPVPLPPIPTYKGENTLSSTETLGEVTVKGRIKERPIVYGWHVDPSVSDPAQAVTYLADAIGKAPAGMTSYRQTVKGYRDLEYIQSTGTQILITDFIPMLSNRYEADIKFTLSEGQAQKIYMGMIQFKNGSEYTRFIVNWPRNSADAAVGRYIFSAGDFSALPNTTVKTSRNTLILDNTTGFYGSTRLGNISVTLPTDATLPIALFGSIQGEEVSNITNAPYNDSEMTLYGFRVYDGTSQLIHNLIPVERIFDSELGLVDTITGTFYANSGTGAFVKGAYITTTEYFDYGDWSDAFFMPKPCMLRSDGTVAYYLDPNDYTKKADGTASDAANASFDGNAMMEWPLIWYKFEAGTADGEGYFYCSNKQVDSSYNCWCNYDANDNIIPHFYTAIYNGTGTDKMRSLSGIQLTPTNGNGLTTGQQEVTRATANNTTSDVEWYTDVYSDRQLISALLILMSKCLDDQAAYGRGLDTGSQTAAESYITGTLNDKGLFYGVTADGNSAVKVFGMENWFGCKWRRTAGLIGGANDAYLYKLTYGTADGSTVKGYNSNGQGYLIANGVSRPANNYVTKMGMGKHGLLPKETAAVSSSSYYGVYYYNGSGYALFGGSSNNGRLVGSLAVNLYYGFSFSYWSIGASLSCKPTKKS